MFFTTERGRLLIFTAAFWPAPLPWITEFLTVIATCFGALLGLLAMMLVVLETLFVIRQLSSVAAPALAKKLVVSQSGLDFGSN
ncbi:hypothetical protein C448_12466 [Halococcus morrhuae DSM 1307]|uniref:Uncharacterized protein n=1 Tax=Halococcus morrhuae DSM 1307 TaxID=931277 RepID=M0M5S2_HALMO|nr:hypothetical protein C448_12466 [Halococcus morrhuae DSM 1307]